MSEEHNNSIHNAHVREQLSDYLDGLLASDEQEVVMAHLAECVDCRADYVELMATQKLLQNVPAIAAPRSFALTPEMAGQARRASFWERLFAPRSAPKLATGSVVAFLLLFLFVAGDFARLQNVALAPNISSSKSGSTDHAFMVAEPTPSTAAAAPDTERNGSDGGATGASAAPTDTTSVAGTSVASAPVTTSAPSANQDTNTPKNASITPNTEVGNSGTGSPTTTTLDNAAEPPFDGSTISGDRILSSSAAPADNRAPATQATGDNRTGWVALQLGLLTLGLALGVAAFISWRRT